MTYKADSNQIGFLQLLSKHAEQNITYHCKETVAYFDSERRTYRRGMKLLAWNDVELTPRGNQRLRYEMILDECRVRNELYFEIAIRSKLMKKKKIKSFVFSVI